MYNGVRNRGGSLAKMEELRSVIFKTNSELMAFMTRHQEKYEMYKEDGLVVNYRPLTRGRNG